MEPIEEGSGFVSEVRNYSDVPDSEVLKDPSVEKLGRELGRWLENLRGAQQRGTMFDRGAYVPPVNVYDEMRVARTAVEFDDVVSGVADITESFAFQGMKWESVNSDEADIFNQWASEVNMDDFLRQIWREEFTLSQVVVATQWGWREYTVRGYSSNDPADSDPAGELPDGSAPVDPATGSPADPATGNPIAVPNKKKGRKRRKKYRLWVPTNLSVLDSTKVVPVGFSPVGPEKLAWYASKAEIGYLQDVWNGRTVDLAFENFFVGVYKPEKNEADRLAKLGVAPDRLLLMNPDQVWRHTLTKGSYDAYPQIRMKSIFGILDMKRQLTNSDRAMLIGAANYILLVRKGTDARPAVQEEVDNLRDNYNFIAKMPVIISDHRLEIEIIAPKTDFTVSADKYQTLDIRILMRLLGTLSLGARGQRNETNVTLSHAVARMMENRRFMIKRAIEDNIARKICEHPRNRKADLSQIVEDPPSLVFMPRHVTLGFDAALLQALLSLRTQREISRETILEQFGLDQGTEAMRLEHEEEFFDDVFKTQIPFGGLPPNNPGQVPTGNTGDPVANGRQGGRPAGGGESPANTTKVTPKSETGNPKRGKST